MSLKNGPYRKVVSINDVFSARFEGEYRLGDSVIMTVEAKIDRHSPARGASTDVHDRDQPGFAMLLLM